LLQRLGGHIRNIKDKSKNLWQFDPNKSSPTIEVVWLVWEIAIVKDSHSNADEWSRVRRTNSYFIEMRCKLSSKVRWPYVRSKRSNEVRWKQINWIYSLESFPLLCSDCVIDYISIWCYRVIIIVESKVQV